MILDFEKARLAVAHVSGWTAWTAAHRAALEAQAQAAVDAERERGRQNLERYGRHIDGECDISVDSGCPHDRRCLCGLRELVEAP